MSCSLPQFFHSPFDVFFSHPGSKSLCNGIADIACPATLICKFPGMTICIRVTGTCLFHGLNYLIFSCIFGHTFKSLVHDGLYRQVFFRSIHYDLLRTQSIFLLETVLDHHAGHLDGIVTWDTCIYHCTCMNSDLFGCHVRQAVVNLVPPCQ